MKNKKWLNYTLGILLTLIVLIVVAGAGFRAGMTQNVAFTRGMRPSFTHDISGAPQGMQGNFQKDGNRQSVQGNSQDNEGPQAMQGNFHGNNGEPQSMQGNSSRQGFDNRGFGRDGRLSFLSPVFGLIRLAVLALLVWVGYKFVKKSGWRLSLSKASPAVPVAAPVPSETPVVEIEEDREEG